MPPRSRLYLGGLLALSNAGRGHRTAGSQARRSQHLRAPRSPNRQVGGHLLRCSRSPGASADSLTRHATPAASSSHYASDLCCRHCGLPLCPHTRPAYDAPWVVVHPAYQRSTTPHGSLARPPQKRPAAEQRPPQTAAPTRSAALPRPRALSFSAPVTGSAPSSAAERLWV